MRGERVAVTGGNGSGKSSLLKIIAGENISRTGTVRLSSGLIISYVPQTAANLSGSLAEFARERDIDYNTFMAVRYFLSVFTKRMKDLKSCSTGYIRLLIFKGDDMTAEELNNALNKITQTTDAVERERLMQALVSRIWICSHAR